MIASTDCSDNKYCVAYVLVTDDEEWFGNPYWCELNTLEQLSIAAVHRYDGNELSEAAKLAAPQIEPRLIYHISRPASSTVVEAKKVPEVLTRGEKIVSKLLEHDPERFLAFLEKAASANESA